MLDYNGRLAGVTIHDRHLNYVVMDSTATGLSVQSAGTFEVDSATSEQFHPLLGCRCVYGINRSEYHRKRLDLADDLAASDPDQFLWELSRSSTENVSNYLYSLLKLLPGEKGIHIECLSINRQTFNHIGSFFDKNHLTLDKMIFEPEALRQCIKALTADERSAFIHLEQDIITMLMFRRGHLVSLEFLRSGDLDGEESLAYLTEEIGTLLMSTFGGRQIRRKLSLTICGQSNRLQLVDVMSKALPYDFTIHEYPFARLGIKPGNLSHDQLHQYFSPLALCYAYNSSRKCASSPETSAVLS